MLKHYHSREWGNISYVCRVRIYNGANWMGEKMENKLVSFDSYASA